MCSDLKQRKKRERDSGGTLHTSLNVTLKNLNLQIQTLRHVCCNSHFLHSYFFHLLCKLLIAALKKVKQSCYLFSVFSLTAENY